MDGVDLKCLGRNKLDSSLPGFHLTVSSIHPSHTKGSRNKGHIVKFVRTDLCFIVCYMSKIEEISAKLLWRFPSTKVIGEHGLHLHILPGFPIRNVLIESVVSPLFLWFMTIVHNDETCAEYREAPHRYSPKSTLTR